MASLTVALAAAGNCVSSNDGGAPQVTTGGVVSRMIVVAVLVMPPAELALQGRGTLPSSVTVARSQSELAAESGSAPSPEPVPPPVSQPLPPAAPSITGVPDGAERSSVSGRHSQAPRRRSADSSLAGPMPKDPLKYGYV